eukprot:301162-Pyramimonas_sp.AAC.1
MKCKEVSRELNFTSAHAIKDLSLTQRVYLGSHCLEGTTSKRRALFASFCFAGHPDDIPTTANVHTQQAGDPLPPLNPCPS